MNEEYGTVTFDGEVIVLEDIPQMGNYRENDVRYYATGRRADGLRVRVSWEVTAEWRAALWRDELRWREEDGLADEDEIADLRNLESLVLPSCDDESLACDWDDPVAVDVID